MEGSTIIHFKIPEEGAGNRIDSYLTGLLDEGFSRTQVQDLIKEGHITMDGETVEKVNIRLKGGEEIIINVPAPVKLEIVSEDMPLEILFQDKDIAVIRKQAGIAVHPSGSIVTGTLVNALLHHLDNLSGIGGVMRPGLVHRLDKGTSGTMVIAKNDVAHKRLQAQFANREVRKRYVAIVRGRPERTSGVVSEPIARHPVHRKKFTVMATGKVSVTEYEVLENLKGHSLVAAHPVTGRTHQIRIHMSQLGHPVLGDTLYGYRFGPGALPEVKKIIKEYPGFMLHSELLVFRHPKTDIEMEFKSKRSSEFERILKLLRYCSLPDGNA